MHHRLAGIIAHNFTHHYRFANTSSTKNQYCFIRLDSCGDLLLKYSIYCLHTYINCSAKIIMFFLIDEFYVKIILQIDNFYSFAPRSLFSYYITSACKITS